MLETLMLVLQLGCLAECMYKGLFWKSLYWVGAFVLTLAVVKGIKS